MGSTLFGRLLSFITRVLHFDRRRRSGDKGDPLLYRGEVAFWHSEEGWGAVRTPELAGVGFVHFAHIRGMEGYRELRSGEVVEFEFADGYHQAGCQYRVHWVRRVDKGDAV